MSFVNIGGVDFPSPSSFKIPQSDLDSSDTTRNELGIMQRDRIRQGIYRIELEFKVNSSDVHKISMAIEPPQFKVTFLSPTGFISRTMYAGDRNVEMLRHNEDYNKIKWIVSFNLIEI